MKWGEFAIEELFSCELSKGDCQPAKLNDGDIPLVSAGNPKSNGIVKFIETEADGKSQLFGTKRLIVDMFGFCTYHPYSFYAVSHGRVNILTPRSGKINDYIGEFITNCINTNFQGNFSYNRMCSHDRLLRQKILLPTTAAGQPDYEFMERYAKHLMATQYRRYLDYLERTGR